MDRAAAGDQKRAERGGACILAPVYVGGSNPCNLYRKDLLKKGVPLNVGTTQRHRGMPQRCRVKTLYAHERWLSIPKSVRRETTYARFVQKASAEFDNLPAEEQQRRRADAMLRGRLKSADAGHDDGSPASSADHSLLWGMGSDDLPIDAGVVEMHIRQKIGCPEDTRRTFGFTAWARSFSGPLLRAMLVADRGATGNGEASGAQATSVGVGYVALGPRPPISADFQTSPNRPTVVVALRRPQLGPRTRSSKHAQHPIPSAYLVCAAVARPPRHHPEG